MLHVEDILMGPFQDWLVIIIIVPTYHKVNSRASVLHDAASIDFDKSIKFITFEHYSMLMYVFYMLIY